MKLLRDLLDRAEPHFVEGKLKPFYSGVLKGGRNNLVWEKSDEIAHVHVAVGKNTSVVVRKKRLR